MPDAITLTGLVATPPRHLVTSEGLPITSFRLASTQRRFDRPQQKWIDGETNWYTITAFRQLALNSNASVEKGQRILVTGRLKIRDWENGERTGTTVEIEAESIGHDLAWGTAAFTRSVSTATIEAATIAPAEPEAPSGDEFPSEFEAAAPADEDAVPVPF